MYMYIQYFYCFGLRSVWCFKALEWIFVLLRQGGRLVPCIAGLPNDYTDQGRINKQGHHKSTVKWETNNDSNGNPVYKITMINCTFSQHKMKVSIDPKQTFSLVWESRRGMRRETKRDKGDKPSNHLELNPCNNTLQRRQRQTRLQIMTERSIRRETRRRQRETELQIMTEIDPLKVTQRETSLQIMMEQIPFLWMNWELDQLEAV